MKILCFIDSFVSGGAQRQMVLLASGLQALGHRVEMFVYYPDLDFFCSHVDRAGIRVHTVKKQPGFSFRVLLSLVSLLHRERYDAVVSFLGSPNVYAELARLFSPSTKLLVSERNSNKADGGRLPSLLKRALHALASGVISNNHAHADWLERHFWLRGKVKTIYNGFEIRERTHTVSDIETGSLRLIAIGRIVEQKNPLGLIRALELFYARHGYVPRVSWVGRREQGTSGEGYWQCVVSALDAAPAVRVAWEWLGEREDVFALMAGHHALILPSLFEGLPNVVCEAFIAGIPVLASDVCDNSLLLGGGERGVLFDPLLPESIAGAIERFLGLSSGERTEMADRARRYGEEALSVGHMARKYESALLGLMGEGGR